MEVPLELTIEEVAARAGTDVGYVRRLIDLGAIGPEQDGFSERDAHVVALLQVWERAGLPAESILSEVESGELSLDFLEAPGWDLPAPLDRTYRQLAHERGVPVDLLVAIHGSIGFAPPDSDEWARPDDALMADLARIVLDIGGSEDSVRRLFRVYADNLRRLVIAEADLYVEQIEEPRRRAGATSPELMRGGAEVGRRIAALVKDTIGAISARHRQHIWAQHSVETAEGVLERAGLTDRAERVPTICFVDLTGYTRLTEEHGDETAARLASRLNALVDGGSQARGQAGAVVGRRRHVLVPGSDGCRSSCARDDEGAPAAGLPPTHIGIHSGPVVFQDGDVYGRTVNVASRIADLAQAGDVLTSEVVTMRQAKGVEVGWVRVGPTGLQGIGKPVILYRAVPSTSNGSSEPA